MNRLMLMKAPAGELPVAYPSFMPPQWQPVGLVQLVVEASAAWRARGGAAVVKVAHSQMKKLAIERDRLVLQALRDAGGVAATKDLRAVTGVEEGLFYASAHRLREAGQIKNTASGWALV